MTSTENTFFSIQWKTTYLDFQTLLSVMMVFQFESDFIFNYFEYEDALCMNVIYSCIFFMYFFYLFESVLAHVYIKYLII